MSIDSDLYDMQMYHFQEGGVVHLLGCGGEKNRMQWCLYEQEMSMIELAELFLLLHLDWYL